LKRNHATLKKLGFQELPDQSVYSQCRGSNARFSGDTITALLNFDFTHRDARAADIARSLWMDCGTSVKRTGAWMAGYVNLADHH
jgi:Ser/Thr protein kinase RdoA (MazF antagonist)